MVIKDLHKAIAGAGIPIDGVADLGEEGYRIDFTEEATEEQREQAAEIIATWQPPLIADWQKFIDGLSPAVFGKVAASPMAAFIAPRLARLADKGDDWQGTSDRLLVLWNAATPALSASERKLVNDLAIAHNLPVKLGTDNKMAIA